MEAMGLPCASAAAHRGISNSGYFSLLEHLPALGAKGYDKVVGTMPATNQHNRVTYLPDMHPVICKGSQTSGCRLPLRIQGH